MTSRNRRVRIAVDLTELELDAIHEKMSRAGVRNRSAFVRQMALAGYIIQLDLAPLQKTAALLSNISNNVNQIAKRVNSGEEIAANDILEIQQGYLRLREELGEVFDELKNMTE